VIGEPASGPPTLALVGEQMKPGELLRMGGELVAEAAKRAPPVERALEASGQRGVGHSADELRHIPPPVMRICLHPQPVLLVLELFVVLVIVVRRVMPDLAGEKVDPPAAPDRIALQDRRELLEVYGERAKVARVPLECVRELSIALKPAPAQPCRALTGERIVGFREQSVACQLQHGVQRTTVNRRAERRDVLLRDRGPQLSQRIAVPVHGDRS